MITKILTIVFLLTIAGCSSTTEPFVENDYTITLDGRLPVDPNGNYRLRLSRVNYQTVHRLEGLLTPVTGVITKEQKVFWESSHYWWFTPGDTAVTIIRRNVNDQGQWVNVDTLYWRSPDSLVVPTINPTSYTDTDGRFSGMIGPTIDMLGDTMTIRCRWYSQWYDSDTINTFIKICLE